MNTTEQPHGHVMRAKQLCNSACWTHYIKSKRIITWLILHVQHYRWPSPQQQPWGQRKVAIMRRWGCNVTPIFGRSTLKNPYLSTSKSKCINLTEIVHRVDLVWWPFTIKKTGVLSAPFVCHWLTCHCQEVIISVGTSCWQVWDKLLQRGKHCWGVGISGGSTEQNDISKPYMHRQCYVLNT